MRRRFQKMMILVVVSFTLFIMKSTNSYWVILNSKDTTANGTVQIGSWEEGALLDRLPPNTPDYVIQRLEELALTNSSDIIDILVNAIIDLVLYPGFNDYFHIGGTLDDLFDKTSNPSFNSGDVIIFVENNELKVVSVLNDYTVGGWGINDFLQQLNSSWGSLKYVVDDYQTGVLYLRTHAPIFHEGNYYYARWQNNSEPQLGNNAWFLITNEWYREQVYHRDHIVIAENRHFLHLGSNNANNNPLSNSWAWQEIFTYNTITNYQNGQVVYVNESGNTRYYRLLVGSSVNVSPSVESTRNGIWQEISNAWIGPTGELVHSYYFSDNTYKQNQVVVFGINPKHRYSYFRAIRDVPYGIMPFSRNARGYYSINDTYWEYINE